MRQVVDDEIAETIRRTLETHPAGAMHYGPRGMAEAVGHAPSTIHRIWKAFGLQPHRRETFKLSSDPLFVEKVCDIVGLYLDPPDRAAVRFVDDKSQIQALDRRCRVSKVLDDLDVQLIIANAGTHKTKRIRNWFANRPRWRAHFTPTSASWINQAERFFGLRTERQVRRGVRRSTAELEAAIHAYIQAHNANPEPFRWAKSADDILAAIDRFCRRTLKTNATLRRTWESGH